MAVDFSPTAADYVEYRRQFPRELLSRLNRFGVGLEGQEILDIGAGTGLLARPLVEAGARVTAVDISPQLLWGSIQHDGPHPRHHIVGRAETLPLSDGSFDVVTAAQCWHWFDRRTAPLEMLRVLKRGAPIAVVYQMHIPLPGTVVAATEQLILKYQPKWRHANSAGISGQVLRDLQEAGFMGIESFSFDVSERFTHDQWRGLIRTSSAVGASMHANRVIEFDNEHAKMLDSWPSQLEIPHRVFAAVARKRAVGL